MKRLLVSLAVLVAVVIPVAVGVGTATASGNTCTTSFAAPYNVQADRVSSHNDMNCNAGFQDVQVQLEYYQSLNGTWYKTFNGGGNANFADFPAAACTDHGTGYTSGQHTFAEHWTGGSCGSGDGHFDFFGSKPVKSSPNDPLLTGTNLGNLCNYSFRTHVQVTFNDGSGVSWNTNGSATQQCV